MPNNRSCDNCRFFDFQGGGPDEDGVDSGPRWGLCLRYAPRPLLDPSRSSSEGPIQPVEPGDVVWPAVYPSDRCGEHEREEGVD